MIRWIGLVLVNTSATDGTVDDADRHVMLRREAECQIVGKIADCIIAPIAGGSAPSRRGVTISADPWVGRHIRRQAIRGPRIRLAFEDIGIAANQVGHGIDDGIANAAGGGAIDDLVSHPARSERRGEGIFTRD